ncbi:MAG: T9SS type A sorting domain-containing protein [Fibrobacteria bacterium]|nr:T9SS type A sorting domain-containing protein [Fibrobacteria bacterium]
MKYLKFLSVLALCSFGLLQAAMPKNGSVSMGTLKLHEITSKTVSRDSAFTFEEYIGDGFNGAVIGYMSFSPGRFEYGQAEWVKDAHDYGLWICCGVVGSTSQSEMINGARACASIGADYIQIDEPFHGWDGGCAPFNGSFGEADYTAIQQAAKEASPTGDCPVIITDVDCNEKFWDWSNVDGMMQEDYTDIYHTDYYPDVYTFKAKQPGKFAGVWVWSLVGDIISDVPGGVDFHGLTDELPDEKFVTWFTSAYNGTKNVFFFIFNKKSRGTSGHFGNDWPTKRQTMISVVDRDDPLPQWQGFSPGTAINTGAPDCQVQVKTDFDGGLDPASVECYYTVAPVVNYNTKWIKHDNVTATGTKGTKNWVTITAKRVPFNQASATQNKIMFKIKDVYPYQYHRNARTWKREYKVNIASLDWTGLSNGGVVTSLPADLSINIQNAAGIDVSSVICEYSTDGGATWTTHQAECTGSTGSTAKETVSVKALPFVETVGMKNKIRFSITAGGTVLNSSEYAVNVNLPPVVGNVATTRAGDNLDFNVNIADEKGLRIGSQETVLRDETVMLLHLDNNTNDASGNGFNGALYGDAKFVDHPSWKTGGSSEKMLYLDGDKDYMDLGFGHIGRGAAFTISFWVKAQNARTIFIMGGHDEAGSLQMWGLADKISVSAWNMSRKRVNMSTPSGSFAHNVWKHVTFTCDDKNARIYIDGKLQATADLSGFKMYKFKPFRIGHPVTRWEHFKGYIDEVHVMSKALSDMEIAADCYSGSYRFSGDFGLSWSDWEPGAFDKADGATGTVVMTASGLALSQKPDSLNRIQVVTRDIFGTAGSREFILMENDKVLVDDIDVPVHNITFYPNPFRTVTKLSFKLPSARDVKLEIYSIDGQLVRCFKPNLLSAGSHSLVWDGQGEHGNVLRSGQYFARLTMGHEVLVKKLMMLR